MQTTDRYARHLSLPLVGCDGQRRLLDSHVVVVGAGGLGSPVLLYLAAAGVGRVSIVDDDEVTLSNLQRQVVHGTSDVGRSKAQSAADRLHDLNPDVQVRMVQARVRDRTAHAIIAGADVVVDGSDNFETRYALSDACARAGIPYVLGTVQGFEGQVSVLGGDGAPCYRCLYPDPPPPGSVPACAEAGVLGVLPGIIGTLQAAETIKLLLGIGDPLRGRLLVVDALGMRFHELAILPDPECNVCSGSKCRAGANEERENAMEGNHDDIDPVELQRRLAEGDRLVILDVREPGEWSIGRLDAATHIPMGEVRNAVASLDPTAETVVYCHHGVRSATVAAFLRRSGFRSVHNLAGGIDRWSVEVDPTVPRY